jgi:hypothetical protein
MGLAKAHETARVLDPGSPVPSASFLQAAKTLRYPINPSKTYFFLFIALVLLRFPTATLAA